MMRECMAGDLSSFYYAELGYVLKLFWAHKSNLGFACFGELVLVGM